MIPYTGSGDYCYAYSLHMCLRGSGADPTWLPPPGFLQCLTTMPFGNTYLPEAGLFFFDGDAPDVGLPRALEALGWTCRVERGGDAWSAMEQLREAIRGGPVLLGPVDMGYLTYNPGARYAAGSDHYVTVLAVEPDHVVVHDPKGFPYATLPLAPLLDAWRAERLEQLGQQGYTLRWDFRRVGAVDRREMIARTLPYVAANLQRASAERLYGMNALYALVQLLHAGVTDEFAAHLRYFALPVGVRHKLDAQDMLAEGGKEAAAVLVEEQARLLGAAQFPAVQGDWPTVAALVERFNALEERLIAACASW